ncbi:unnamed protein product [Paramecium octaurelia]|uniref:Uncharacterized protein n=2 Tax=Paramecium octaurelia TaxID=43137 RepID=A0A8S1U1X0_PAROT|nr:unnamed protein product [Paramecium octaurelia]
MLYANKLFLHAQQMEQIVLELRYAQKLTLMEVVLIIYKIYHLYNQFLIIQTLTSHDTYLNQFKFMCQNVLYFLQWLFYKIHLKKQLKKYYHSMIDGLIEIFNTALLQSVLVNSGGTACQTMVSKCADQTSTTCLYSVEGECVVVGTSCVRKTCDTAATDATRDDDSECSAYQQSCTVARLGACQARAACGAYKSSLQCKFNTSGGKCFWNPTNKTCVDLNCGNIEATTSYDTHNECVAVDSTLACTVRATNAAAVQGCMARGACASYTIEEQCKTNASNGVCVWNTNANLSSPACQDKSCTSAPTSTTTHNDCFAYYNTATVRCTVVATPSNSGGSPTLGGCQQTAACSSYIDKEQCQINANGEPCGWNGTQCADKACSTAPATTDYDDDTKCRAYLSNKCTVSDSGLGCVDIPATCETMTQKQCYYNKAGDPCYWTGTACITKSCDNAPDATATAEECNTYLAGFCEDFAFATDALCKQAISTCTTNGTNCVGITLCSETNTDGGCVNNIQNISSLQSIFNNPNTYLT